MSEQRAIGGGDEAAKEVEAFRAWLEEKSVPWRIARDAVINRAREVVENPSDHHLTKLAAAVGEMDRQDDIRRAKKYPGRAAATPSPYPVDGTRPDALCVYAPFGSYRNQVAMWPPVRLGLSGPVGIDLCLASEIAGLWARGIATVSSCCGHGRRKIRGHLAVRPEHEQAMRDLGYEQDTRNPDIAAFVPKTGCGAPTNSTVEP